MGWTGQGYRPSFLAIIEKTENQITSEASILVTSDSHSVPVEFGAAGLLDLLIALFAIISSQNQVVLLDEPGAGVNPSLMDELAEYISSLARDRGVTILLIEHDMDLVMRLCDPVIVLSEGRPLVEGAFATVANDPRVLEAYLGGD